MLRIELDGNPLLGALKNCAGATLEYAEAHRLELAHRLGVKVNLVQCATELFVIQKTMNDRREALDEKTKLEDASAIALAELEELAQSMLRMAAPDYWSASAHTDIIDVMERSAKWLIGLQKGETRTVVIERPFCTNFDDELEDVQDLVDEMASDQRTHGVRRRRVRRSEHKDEICYECPMCLSEVDEESFAVANGCCLACVDILGAG
jgi:hypothetical protein